MDKDFYSSGELASLVGLSVRTIRYYDNIGLLPSSERTVAGHRRYGAADLVRLEQIIIYKKLNFSLKDIQKLLLVNPENQDILASLDQQQYLLAEQMEELHNAHLGIELMKKRLLGGQALSFANLLRAFQLLPKSSIFKQAPTYLSPQQREKWGQVFSDNHLVTDFYHDWKEAIMEALFLQAQGLAANSPEAQEMASHWWAALERFSAGLPAGLGQEIADLNLEAELTQNQADLILAKDYLEEALNIYLEGR
ncbi:MerR family transcriptional regulator [Streptococcus oricebi]|uniref:HTH merR-type domain-containing protein n=1 Tax=Streptococcus oricebi TaxID=1547447 RepID=A0ABS5B3C6_9STRE|nr:MerR family transcriptional regulator [Streptococcus oricebi]MBP2623338.1 hypothetical protein [Streptococcus oricebi]